MQETEGHYRQSCNSQPDPVRSLISICYMLRCDPARRTVVPSARTLFRDSAREPNTWRFSRVWDKSTTPRRHDPEQVTGKIIESPGGATCSGADGVLAGLFQQPA